jgi:hypothetical protein
MLVWTLRTGHLSTYKVHLSEEVFMHAALMQVVALPPVDLVISGQIKAQDIPPTSEKVDIWALGVTLYELVTGDSRICDRWWCSLCLGRWLAQTAVLLG